MTHHEQKRTKLKLTHLLHPFKQQKQTYFDKVFREVDYRIHHRKIVLRTFFRTLLKNDFNESQTSGSTIGMSKFYCIFN